MARPHEVSVMQSLAFKAAYLELVPEFERAAGHRVKTLWATTNETLQRIESGEIVDCVILSAASIAKLVMAGLLSAATRVNLATCGVGVAVRAGAPKPDLSSGDALRRAVLQARSIVYSHGPSGVYLEGLFRRMGIADQIAPKVRRVQGEPAGAVVARGEAELGFQQVSELLPITGIELAGTLPPEVQEITTFGAAIHTNARNPEGAQALLRFFKSPAAAGVIRKSGMEPA